MKVTFWGVRGGIAVSGAQYARTGGNTTCIEVQHNDHRLILDGGTGLRALGASLGFLPVEATVVFTHLHWDHIQGVPFFAPAFHPDSDLTFVGMDRTGDDLRRALDAQMQPPQFPVGLDTLKGVRTYENRRPDRPFEVGPFRITPLDSNHPDGVVVLRVEAGGKCLVFATDVEHAGRIDRRLTRLARHADLLVHDAQYTTREYRGELGPSRVGWGHSTVSEAVEVALRADAKRLALFHHDPARTDDAVAVLEARASDRFIGSMAAREGVCVAL